MTGEHNNWQYLIAINSMACTTRGCGWVAKLEPGVLSIDQYRQHQKQVSK